MEGDSEGGRCSAAGGEDRGRRMGKLDLTPVTTAKLLFPVHTPPSLHAGTQEGVVVARSPGILWLKPA